MMVAARQPYDAGLMPQKAAPEEDVVNLNESQYCILGQIAAGCHRQILTSVQGQGRKQALSW